MFGQCFPALKHWGAYLIGLGLTLASLDRLVVQLRVDPIAPKYREMFGGGPPCTAVIFGTSHASHGVNPRALEAVSGKQWFNFAFNLGNPLFYNAWFEDYVAFYGRPKTVLLGVDWFFLKPYGWLHVYAQDAEYWPWGRFLNELLRHRDIQTPLANRFALIKERDNLQDRLVGISPSWHYQIELGYRGFVPLAPQAHDLLKPEQNQYADDPTMAMLFERWLSKLQSEGTRVIFFQAPTYIPLASRHEAEDQNLERIARAHQVEFLNYNTNLRSPLNEVADYFADVGHLNQLGAEAFSHEFAHDLRKRGLI